MKRANRKTDELTILSCDPSFTAWGWVIVRSDAVISHGCIKTEPEAKKRRIREGDDRVRRTGELVRALIKIIQKHDVSFIVSELPHGSQNAKAAVMIGIVVGIIQTLSLSLDIPVEWYSENDAKKALLNRKTISKRDVIDTISKLYDVEWQFKSDGKPLQYYNEAVADALTIFHVATKQSTFLQFYKKQNRCKQN